jgi:hypothetical protein
MEMLASGAVDPRPLITDSGKAVDLLAFSMRSGRGNPLCDPTLEIRN